jgi:acetolactate synthase-1/3 small subunit
MVLIKVAPKAENRAETLRIAEIFRGVIVDSSHKTYTIQITGDEKKLEAIIDLLKPMGIKELVRTGKVAIARNLNCNSLTAYTLFSVRVTAGAGHFI